MKVRLRGRRWCPRLLGVPIRLEPLTPNNDTHVRALRVVPGQERFVETVEESLADAQPHPQAWLRAAYDANELVGFVMLWDSFEEPGHMLWRLPHWHIPTQLLGEDDHGIWLGVPERTVMWRPGVWVETHYAAVVLVPKESPFVAMFMDRVPCPE